MEPIERLQEGIKNALKSGDKIRSSTLRMLLADVKNEAIAQGRDLTDDDLVTLARRGIKRRKEAASQYREGDRVELAEKEEAEAAILEEYLPPQVDEEILRAAIRQFVDEQGLEGPRGIGAVMKEMMSRYAGQADGSVISAIAKDILTS